MTKEKYNEIRTKNTFLYEYFVEETNNRIPPVQFDEFLDIWLMTRVGVHAMHGREVIVKYLDTVLRD